MQPSCPDYSWKDLKVLADEAILIGRLVAEETKRLLAKSTQLREKRRQLRDALGLGGRIIDEVSPRRKRCSLADE
jgi:hypothetical protein